MKDYIKLKGWQIAKKYLTFKHLTQGNFRGYSDWDNGELEQQINYPLMDHRLNFVDKNNKPVAIISQSYGYTSNNLLDANNLLNERGIIIEELLDVEAYHNNTCKCVLFRRATDAELTFFKLKKH